MLAAVAGFGTTGTWKRNLEMFRGRFSPETTWGEGPRRLKNLYFVYLLELRALHKLAPYLRAEMFYTGDTVEDEQTRQLMHQLRDAIGSFPDHFDETVMFQVSHFRSARTNLSCIYSKVAKRWRANSRRNFDCTCGMYRESWTASAATSVDCGASCRCVNLCTRNTDGGGFPLSLVLLRPFPKEPFGINVFTCCRHTAWARRCAFCSVTSSATRTSRLPGINSEIICSTVTASHRSRRPSI